MAKFGKILGAGLGWAFGGPLGALFGVAVGAMFDKMDSGEHAEESNYQTKYQKYRHHSTRADFDRALITLSAAVMKADGKVLVSELEYVKAFFRKHFGPEDTGEYLQILKSILDKEIPLQQVASQVGYFMEEAAKLQLLHYLFGIAKSDGSIHAKEVDVLHNISIWMGIGERDFRSIYAMFAGSYSGSGQSSSGGGRSYKRSLNDDFEVLEIEPTSDEKIIKKAYRTLAKKYHPDRVAHLGEEHVESAKEKFQTVQEAYDNICKAKNIV